LGREPPFTIVKLQKKRFVVSNEGDRAMPFILRTARRLLWKQGVATITAVADQVNKRASAPESPESIARILQRHPGFAWLDQPGGWFWLRPLQSPLRRRLRKILAVCSRIDAARLQTGIYRGYRLKGLAPPPPVLLELWRQLPECRLEGNWLIADPPPDPAKVLSRGEAIVRRIFKENGSALATGRLERLSRKRGLKHQALWRVLTSSPILEKYGYGVHGLRGAEVSQELIQSLAPSRRDRRLIGGRSVRHTTKHMLA
jgi:hypothetical protein